MRTDKVLHQGKTALIAEIADPAEFVSPLSSRSWAKTARAITDFSLPRSRNFHLNRNRAWSAQQNFDAAHNNDVMSAKVTGSAGFTLNGNRVIAISI